MDGNQVIIDITLFLVAVLALFLYKRAVKVKAEPRAEVIIKVECRTCNSWVEPKALYYTLHGEELGLTSRLITAREQLTKLKQGTPMRAKLEGQVNGMEAELNSLKTLVDLAGKNHPHHYRSNRGDNEKT